MSRGAIIVVLVFAAAALALGSSPGMAVVATLHTHDGYNVQDSVGGITGYGGEFEVDVTAGGTDWYIHQTDPDVRYGYPTNMSFATFCVNLENLSHWPTQYTVNTDQLLPTNGAVAWLYDQWYSGTLPGYDYTGVGDLPGQPWREDIGRSKDAQQLQRMIWQFTGLGTWSYSSGKYAGWYGTALANQNQPPRGVQIMQLETAGQHLLVLVPNGHMVPIPEPGSLALLATGALGLLPLLRRRRTT